MKINTGNISFGGVLCLLGLLYISFSFLTGEMILQIPNSWFVTWMANIFQKMDESGFFNVWTGYCQGFHYLYFIIWKPAHLLAGNQYYFALTFSLMWYFISTGAIFLSAYLFYRIVVVLWGKEKGLLYGMVFILLSLTMPQWYTVVDSITIAGILGAVYCILKGSTRTGGLILGITASLKPFGLLILPVLLKSEFLTWKARLALVITSVGSFTVLLLPFMIGNYKIFLSSFNWQSGRPPWETAYAFIMWALDRPFPANPFFADYSGVNARDWGWTGITPIPSMMTTPVPDYNPWYNWLSLLLLVFAALAFVIFKKVRTPEELVTGIACLLGLFFAFFYGWSHQFVFWILPFLLVCFPFGVSVAMRLVVLLEYPFFYALYLANIAPDIVTAAPGLTRDMTTALSVIGVPGYWSLVLLRTILLLTLAVLAWRKLPAEAWNVYLNSLPRLMGIQPDATEKIREQRKGL